MSSLAAQPDRRVLVLVNPFGGSGKAVRIFQRDVVPMFAESGLQYQLVVTGLICFCVDLVIHLLLSISRWFIFCIAAKGWINTYMYNKIIQQSDIMEVEC